jgi:hypothetical protein
MLDTDTKRRIDTARDILVGKVPDPKSQVEQITIALIYKFMDDMDAESEEFGGKRKFFAGEFARYGWAKLMRSGLGGHETLNLYAEAIAKMPENPGIPLLFRDIFKNAYLPYRDPETLRAFLKVIDEFNYDHSERLGDAFEYLLSVLGSQGDAGQFRTPRHIIDIWHIKQTRPHEFGMAMVGFNKDLEKELLEATSPFTFWRVNESSVLRFLKLIGCDNAKVGSYASLVKERNDTAHSNGNIFFSTEDALNAKITEVLRVVDEIQTHSRPVIEQGYRDFLLQNHDPEEREYPDAADQIREMLIHENYLSQKDIEPEVSGYRSNNNNWLQASPSAIVSGICARA